jgi:ABC-type Fe3+-hydroxamate transport system substrate-binding protein
MRHRALPKIIGETAMSGISVLKCIAAVVLAAGCMSTLAAAKPASPHRTARVFAHVASRNVGPAIAGGRVTAVAGSAGNPRVYYLGSAGGGVFKSTDGGFH